MSSDKEDLAYDAGSVAAWRCMLRKCLRELGHDEDLERERLVLEISEARSQLRSLCAEFGDNDFGDDLHLGDAIEKHLGKHLYDGWRNG